MKQTLKEAGYSYVKALPEMRGVVKKEHILLNNTTKEQEVWVANKNHASFGIKYKNTHLEFCCTYIPN